MSNLARQEMYFGRFFTLDELLEGIEVLMIGGSAQSATTHHTKLRREPLILLDAGWLSLPLHVTLIGSNARMATSCSSGLRCAGHER